MLTIYVSHASDCLTDHLPHGEGLLCFLWIKSLCDIGHKVYAFTPSASILEMPKNLTVYTSKQKILFRSLSYLVYRYESKATLKKIMQKDHVDLIWRMYPYGIYAPYLNTKGRPFVLGPLYTLFDTSSINPPIKFSFKPFFFINFFSRLLWIRTLKCADAFLLESAQTRDSLMPNFYHKPMIHLPAIVEPKLEISRRIPPTMEAEVKIAFVGHFHPSKRLLDFCKVIKMLLDNQRNVKGYIVGEGEEYENALSYISNHKLNDKFSFKGRLSNNEIYKFLSEMHILITLRAESYGRTIVESMSVGTPNVCVNKFAASEFMRNGVTGILLDDISCESYAKAVEALINDKDTWLNISINSMNKAKSWLSSEIGKSLSQHFYSILNN